MYEVQKRMCELIAFCAHRSLNGQEEKEWDECEKAIVKHLWKEAKHKNLMMIAHQNKDYDWLKEIRQEWSKQFK